MNYKENLDALKARLIRAEKAVHAVNRVNTAIAAKQAEISAISAEATGPAAKLRQRLCDKLEKLEAERVVAISEADDALEPDPVFQPAAIV